ncbi:MAG: DUF1343 domain-containing protein [Bacteroidales bacterium]|nr:DUF1343 domain-containing protein [Bacteroidales bacterium]
MVYHLKRILIILACLTGTISSAAQVIPGAARAEIVIPLLKGKRIGIVANDASVIPLMVNGSDTAMPALINTVKFFSDSGIRVVKIFSPEHGFGVTVEAGGVVADGVDPVTGIPVVSLYGAHKKPTPMQLDGLDAMVFDIQDVGVRFYTYISTLTFLMEACAQKGLPLIVLDRPNPNGFYVDGPVMKSGYTSFVGMHPVPVVYGMTIGEYALMVNGEKWLSGKVTCDLTVIPVAGYTHQTRMKFLKPPSPNLPDSNAIYLYPSLCFFEGTIMSVGRGTDFPFEVFGHPAFPDTTFSFFPVSVQGKAAHPPYEGTRCRGADLRDYYKINPGSMGRIHLGWLIRAYELMKGEGNFFNDYFDKLAGSDALRKSIIRGKNETEIRRSWKADLLRFKKIRSRYLLYADQD